MINYTQPKTLSVAPQSTQGIQQQKPRIPGYADPRIPPQGLSQIGPMAQQNTPMSPAPQTLANQTTPQNQGYINPSTNVAPQQPRVGDLGPIPKPITGNQSPSVATGPELQAPPAGPIDYTGKLSTGYNTGPLQWKPPNSATPKPLTSATYGGSPVGGPIDNSKPSFEDLYNKGELPWGHSFSKGGSQYFGTAGEQSPEQLRRLAEDYKKAGVTPKGPYVDLLKPYMENNVEEIKKQQDNTPWYMKPISERGRINANGQPY